MTTNDKTTQTMQNNRAMLKNIQGKNTFRLLLVAAFTLAALLPARYAGAQFTLSESFKGNSLTSNLIILGGDPNKAYLTSERMVEGDPPNEGWLRLTTATTRQLGYAYIDESFPSNLGLYIEFEYKAWRNASDYDGNTTYHGADGFSVFLFDAAVSQFKIGSNGAALGYAQNSRGGNNKTGLTGAFLGVGIDEYGDFAFAEDGRDGITTNKAPNSIVVRGPASKNWNYIGHKQGESSKSGDGPLSMDWNKVQQKRPIDNDFYRKVKITIQPIAISNLQQYHITVKWMTNPTGSDELWLDKIVSVNDIGSIPTDLKVGFAASTGMGFNYHEIRNLYVTTYGGVKVTKDVDKITAEVGEELTYRVSVTNETGGKVENLKLLDKITDGNDNEIPTDLFEITSITFNNGGDNGNSASINGTTLTHNEPVQGGLANPLSVSINMAQFSSTAHFTIKGRIKAKPDGGIIRNTATLDYTESDIYDPDPFNDSFSVGTEVTDLGFDLVIQKTVDNRGLVKEPGGNTFHITVSNNGSNAKPVGRVVTVTDIIPDELTVTNVECNSGWSYTQNGKTYTFTNERALNSRSVYSLIKITVKAPEVEDGTWTNTAKLECLGDPDITNNESSATIYRKNYWYGNTTGTDEERKNWGNPENWTAKYVPLDGDNIEFATDVNNLQWGGVAKNDLHLDKDRIIGDLVNYSGKDLWVTTDNMLTVNGEIKGNIEYGIGRIIVKADPLNEKPNGSLIFTNPSANNKIRATVEFYNKAYQCDNCGYYRKQWQYFGIPVNSGPYGDITSSFTPVSFPYEDVLGEETVNRWDETHDGDKWRPVGNDGLYPFKGYEITNSITTPPAGVYKFTGRLLVGNHNVELTRTPDVNYPGVNLIGNSYTAAIPIRDGISFPAGTDATVYLFNTGTRDQWRRLNGGSSDGVAAGQYLAVPIENAGQNGLPSVIPSMHAFMVMSYGGTLFFDHSKLKKNRLITDLHGNPLGAMRSVTAGSGDAEANGAQTAVRQLPSLVMDVIGDKSADRVWVFSEKNATYGFDNGWDARKMDEPGIAQLFVSASDGSRLQVATVPAFDNVTLGFAADADGEYTLEFAPSDDPASAGLTLHDLVAGVSKPITAGNAYTFEAKKGETAARFRLSASGDAAPGGDETLIFAGSTDDGRITVRNNSPQACTAFLSTAAGGFLRQTEVAPGSEASFGDIPAGVYVLRLQNAAVNDIRRIVVE